MQILPAREELYNIPLSPENERLLNTLMRQYPGIFTEPAYIYEDRLASMLETDKQELNHRLIMLAQQGLVRYIPRRKTPYIYYAQERLQLEYIRIPKSCYEDRLAQYEQRIRAMLDYAQLADSTKAGETAQDERGTCLTPEQFLLGYFGE